MREMKESGVEWIGEIPASWEIGRIKYNYYLKGRIGWQGLKAEEFTDEGPYLVTGTDFCNGKVNWSTCYHITDERYEEAPEIHVQLGDLLITKDGTVGKVAYIENKPDKVSLNSHLLIMRPLNHKYNNKYLFWIIQSPVFDRYIQLSQNGTIMASLSQEKINKFSFPLPLSGIQTKIVEYLDYKCSQIDLIVEKQRAIIEKLKEYKSSVINEALTHGLEETCNYKESGIDWIGKIPEHWSVQKLKTIVDILPGYAFSSNDFATDEGIPLLRGINVVPGGIRWNDVVFWNQGVPKYLEPYYLQKNDIVVGLDRPWISDGMRTTIMDKDSLPCLLLQRVCRIRIKKECAYDHRLIYHWINSKAFESALSIETTGVSVPHISTKQIENFIIALPPHEEARSICDYSQVKTREIDKSISIRSHLIGKLLDYKKSLIYEVVTGKREV